MHVSLLGRASLRVSVCHVLQTTVRGTGLSPSLGPSETSGLTRETAYKQNVLSSPHHILGMFAVNFKSHISILKQDYKSKFLFSYV